MNLQTIQSYTEQILNYAFFISEELNKEQRERDEVKQKIIDINFLKQNNNCDVVFTEKEMNTMPRMFRKIFIANGCRAHVRKKQNSKNSYSYEIRYRKGGYNVRAASTNLEEAKQKFIAALNAAEKEPEQQKIPTLFNDFAEHYFENYYKEKVILSTYKNIYSVYTRWVKPHFEKQDIRKITPNKCKELLDKIKALNKGKTCDEVYSIMNQIFKMAMAYNLINKNPLAVILHENHEEEIGEPLTKEEEKKLLSECLPKYKTIFAIYLYTGIRPGEIKFLEVESEFIITRNTKRKNHKIEIKKIPITPMLHPYVNDIKTTTPKVDDIRKEMKRILPNHKLKDCRTTFSTRCQECGVNIQVLKRWMGHKDTDVLGAHYTKFSDEYMLSEAQKVRY